MSDNITYIIGHRNPDADSICSAIAYSALKSAQGIPNHLPARCGNSNARIDTLLRRFRQPLPVFLSDVTPRVRDVMVSKVHTIEPQATCSDALSMLEDNNVRVLPVIDQGKNLLGSISIFQLGKFFTPKIRNPRDLRRVHSSLSHITRSLNACTLHIENPDRVEELYTRVGAMDIASFNQVTLDEATPAHQSIIIVGDRRDIQERSIELGVRALIITGNFTPREDIISFAKKNKVSILLSPHDTATTALIIRTATILDGIYDSKFTPLADNIRLSDLHRKLAASTLPAHMVVDDEGRLIGILSKTDILKPSKTKLILVDHNELSQAVPGADQVIISEIIDHHRLGSPATEQPILFINDPVGSTCTIITDLYRRANIRPEPNIAGLMMGGIISDTLNLSSPTTTPRDTENLAWLSAIAGVSAEDLASEFFSAGSIILNNSAEEVVNADLKRYNEAGVSFAVSQVEELGFRNLHKHFASIAEALENYRDKNALYFACLLVTDIRTQNSILVVRGSESFIDRITYPRAADLEDAFESPGIVSRKKQLIPYLSSLLRELAAQGQLEN